MQSARFRRPAVCIYDYAVDDVDNDDDAADDMDNANDDDDVQEVLEAIAETAFKASDFPLILSFENHCS